MAIREGQQVDTLPSQQYGWDGTKPVKMWIDASSHVTVSPYCVDEFGAVSRLLGDNIFQGSLIVISPEHHEIHCGDSYEMNHTVDLTNGQVYNFLIIVPNATGTGQTQKQWHFKHSVSTEAEALIEFFEAPTTTANGTAITNFNRNRNLAATYNDVLATYHTPTVTGDGTQLLVKRIGSGMQVGGGDSRSDELILKNNTPYLLRVTNATATANYMNAAFDYYVHPGA